MNQPSDRHQDVFINRSWVSSPSLPQLLAKLMDSACLMRVGGGEVTNTFNDLSRPSVAPAQSERSGVFWTAAWWRSRMKMFWWWGRFTAEWIRRAVKRATRWIHRPADVSWPPVVWKVKRSLTWWHGRMMMQKQDFVSLSLKLSNPAGLCVSVRNQEIKD